MMCVKWCSQMRLLKDVHIRYDVRSKIWRRCLEFWRVRWRWMEFPWIRIWQSNWLCVFLYDLMKEIGVDLIYILWFVDLCGMKLSIQQCLLLRRLLMVFMSKLPKLMMILRYFVVTLFGVYVGIVVVIVLIYKVTNIRIWTWWV